ncbi:MAG: hypothetical protein K2X77_25245 [Candidatus Obscuribacterales bacterium]|jgi:hypothetical protein|nr:hypothetical protein [Candidatus Obscuribacterales bacterium]
MNDEKKNKSKGRKPLPKSKTLKSSANFQATGGEQVGVSVGPPLCNNEQQSIGPPLCNKGQISVPPVCD